MLKVISGIYAIVNRVTGSLYIGSSQNIQKRLGTHKKLLLRNKHPNKHLQNSVNKHGISEFSFQVIHEVDCSRSDLLKYEKLFIMSEHPGKLFNMMCPLVFYSENTNKSEFLARRVKTWKETVAKNGGLPPCSEETRKLISEAVSGEKNGFFGKKHNPDTKGKISEKAKERWRDLEERERQSERRKKYFEDPLARARVGEKSRGRKQSAESKLKASQRNRGSGNPNAQPICFQGVIYGSIKEACETLGISKYKLKKLLKPNDYLERE